MPAFAVPFVTCLLLVRHSLRACSCNLLLLRHSEHACSGCAVLIIPAFAASSATLPSTPWQFLKAMALGTLVAAFALPMAAMSALNMLLGDRWVAALRRSKLVGVLLAHQLVSGCAGGCPVILVAFSMGARAVFHCLLELHRLGKRGIVQHVVLMGTPVQVNEEKWAAARSVVSGRFVNAYSDKARQCQP